MSIRQVVPTLLLLTVTAALVQPVSAAEDFSWQSHLYRDHPLVGRIWNAHTGEFLPAAALLEALTGASIVLLGEKHDNPDHHSLQLEILQDLARSDRLQLLALEMLDADQQALLPALAGLDSEASLESLREALAWDADGWDWNFYGPLVQHALRARVPLVAANISRDQMSEIYRSDDAQPWLGMLDDTALAALHEEIDRSHCQLLPASQFPAMVRVQQARDFRMAQSLLGSEVTGAMKTRVLVAGNFHVRRDLGVPRYLQQLDPFMTSERVVSLAILEVDESVVEPGDYLESISGTPAYDFIWFTPALTDEDYCASLQSR